MSDVCIGKTLSGGRCSRKAIKGSKYCYQHGTKIAKVDKKSKVEKETKVKKETKEKSLYDQLGGIFSIAAVVNRFSDKILENPLVGVDSPNPQLRKWSRDSLDRLPGLKFMRTLWVASLAGGPFNYKGTHPDSNSVFGLHNAHARFHITSEEFDAVAKELKSALKYYKVPDKLIKQVLSVFEQHKKEVVSG